MINRSEVLVLTNFCVTLGRACPILAEQPGAEPCFLNTGAHRAGVRSPLCVLCILCEGS